MFIFKNSFNKKSTALILAICITTSIIAPGLLYPQQAKSALPVEDVWHTPLQIAWEALKVVWREIMEYWTTISGMVDVWIQSNLILEWALGVALNLLINQLLAQLTNDIVNWIQNGTTPRFLTMGLDDWLGMAADNALGIFIEQYLGMGWLCEPFDIDIKIALLDKISFKEEVECSVTDIVKNIEDFYNDFATGGWKGWVELVEGRNIIYSAYEIAHNEKMKIIETDNKEKEAEIARGDGFFSPKDCIWFDANNKPIDLVTDSTGRRYTTGYDDVWGTASLYYKCQPSTDPMAEPFDTVGGVAGPCYVKCISHTPGKQISDATSQTLNRYWDSLNALLGAAAAKAGPLAIYVEAILTALINRAFTEGYGLLFAGDQALSNGGEPIPNIFDPTEIMQDKVAVGSLEITLPFLKESLNGLLKEQKSNLGVLNLILDEYNEIEPILDQILDPSNGCGSDAIAWANSKKTDIAKKITDLEEEIEDMEGKIKETESAIDRINKVIMPAIEDYYEKYDEWEKAYNDAGGRYDPNDPNDPVTKAATELDEIKKEIIEQTQLLLEEINGSYTGTTLPELQQEVSDTYINVNNVLIPKLQEERGDPTFPASGTLYARLEEAKGIKETANDYLGSCGINAFYKQTANYIYALNGIY